MRPAGGSLAARVASAGLTVTLAALAVALSACGEDRAPLFEARLQGPDRLLSNEYAFHHPRAPGAVRSPQWFVTSGSLFLRSGAATDGRLDHFAPDPRSLHATNSAVFRAYTWRRFRPDYRVSFELRIRPRQPSSGAAAASWDGVHLMLEARGPGDAYYVSLYRRDGQAVIKKKTSPGPIDGGSYRALSKYVSCPIMPGRWTQIEVDARESETGAVTIDLYEGGALVATASDDLAVSGTPPLREGRLGIRADETTFEIRELTVAQL